MKCPACRSRLECCDSRHSDFNTVKRRRQCTGCDYVSNSIEVLLPEDLNGKRTARTAYRMLQAASGAAEADRVARLLRHLADDLESTDETP